MLVGVMGEERMSINSERRDQFDQVLVVLLLQL